MLATYQCSACGLRDREQIEHYRLGDAEAFIAIILLVTP